MPDVHAKLSASGANRWMNCTPSVALEKEFKETGSTYAEEGTFAHSLAELINRYNLGEIDKKVYNKKLDILKENQHYNPEMMDYIDNYTNEIWRLSNEAKAKCKDRLVLLEQRLDFSEYVPDSFGTGDVVIIADDTLHIIDLKYGKGVGVSAENNPQLRLYGLGALSAFGLLYDINKIKMTIIQPRLDMMTSEELTVEELTTWAEKEVKPKAELAIEGKGEFVVGDHCKFCKAKAVCKARAEENLRLAQFDFSIPELLQDAEIGEILIKADNLASWVKDIHEYAFEQALQGKKWEGWKLVEGRSVRTYADQSKVAERLIENGYKEAIIYEKSLLSITAMEKVVGKKNFETVLEGLITKPPGKPTLVQENDKRQELSNIQSAALDFAD